ncbi:dihydroorotate dehydrogenase family protein [Candidatus Desulforudis audaxviator MP104C]|uniref:Dihydroorotate dehydrogenase B (NAD(+)), catalytic subunit n=1 Tax=Desulforudis audaxviator (strain MP104C) TaxID=477974 RepID=PYRDB_DESAP|nr:dihydroorotate dehydrogenase [Candidatus Desulforudis audaxviator]B1I4M6.1 RecName: Full=Dihydroorotate dehydrogenase B (NAD(+)), catalytic subunit; Short=DHOD B; Short=DHODase B; Short=DHOdehase B; AltName: Full=Dihydroorotate oxidase B; AltName: Full=Orotate reductase (NADH) [Candidatus Desulforudis audaxviator MP104C]ACA59811.1 dihydroorotate dehydrogenase family protein [Candidatus Desulforudis audaxviator MP104C]AZK59814.1 Dihydroorotate dehydrogenase, catalytic subunit [Candidatus Desul
MKVKTAVAIAGLTLKNPVLTASGTVGFGEEYAPYLDLAGLGALVVKTVTLKPRAGNPPPRITETPAGVINAVGLQNPGVEALVRDILPRLARFDVPVIVSIAGETVDEYARLAGRLDGVPGIAALEVNISCPNVKAGGIAFGTEPAMTAAVVRQVRENTRLPVIAKLSPNVTDIRTIALAAAGAGADALSLINTLSAMVIDVERRRPLLGNVFGGLSGPAVRPVAVRAVWQVYQAVELPLIGMGGIMTARDALEFILAGARAVAVGTANLVNPGAAAAVAADLEQYLTEQGIRDINELVGAAHRTGG